MSDLVFVEKKMALCDSRLMAEKFAKGKHAYVIDVIQKVLEREDRLKGRRNRPLNSYPIFIEKENEYRGQKFKYYLLNRTAFMLVVMRFKTDAAYEFQLEFIDAFNRMEESLANHSNATWIQTRETSRVTRKEETSTIARFVEYAKQQGSLCSVYYYKHFTNATYKALELLQHDKPKLRDTLNTMQLSHLIVAEHVAQRKIEQLMSEGLHYKEIFLLTKEAIEKYADATMIKTEILDYSETPAAISN
jgi:Rha family phage regulatory protein